MEECFSDETFQYMDYSFSTHVKKLFLELQKCKNIKFDMSLKQVSQLLDYLNDSEYFLGELK